MTAEVGTQGQPFRLEEATIEALHAAITAGQITCVEIVQHYISTTSLDLPGTELGDLVGRDEPDHDILEEPTPALGDGLLGTTAALQRGDKPAKSAGVHRWRARKLYASMTRARCRCRPSQRRP